MSPFRLTLIATIIIVLTLLPGIRETQARVKTFPRSTLNYRPVGASASELLSADKPSLAIEIQYMPGCKLEQATVDHLVRFIQTYLNKPGGLQVWQREINATPKSTMSVTDLAQIEKQYRTAYSTRRQVAVYILVADAQNTDVNTMAESYWNTSISVFAKTIRRFTNGYGASVKSKLETSTLEHEFAHLLGLTNLGSKMNNPHEDLLHNGHCSNSKCLMYYKAGSNEILGYVNGGDVPSLCQRCRDDLKANGGL